MIDYRWSLIQGRAKVLQPHRKLGIQKREQREKQTIPILLLANLNLEHFLDWNNVRHATGASFSCLSIIPLELSKLGSPEQNNLGKVNLDSFLISVKARYLNRFFLRGGMLQILYSNSGWGVCAKVKKISIQVLYVCSFLHIFFDF